MKNLLLYPTALLFSLLATLLYAQEPEVLIIGHDDFPPIAYIDELGQSQGTLLFYAQQVFSELGYTVKFRPLPSARLYREIATGQVHIWMGAKGKSELKDHVLESTHAISQINLALYYHPDLSPPVLPAALQDQKIIAIRGFSYWENVNAWLNDEALNTQLIPASSHASAIAMLLKRRSNFLLSYQEPMQFTKNKLGIDKLSIPSVILKQIPISFIVSKHHPNAANIVQAIDGYLDKATAEPPNTEKEP